jgi:hypothetical protein
MTAASASSPVAVDPAVGLPTKGADDSLAILSSRCMAVREHRELRKVSLGTYPLAWRAMYDYPPPK